MRFAKTLLRTLGIAAVVFPTFSQVARPSFEVASIKENTTGAGNSLSGNRPGGFFYATNYPVKALITNAYRMSDFQVLGGPDWINTIKWDIEARAEAGAVAPPAGPPEPDRPDTMALMVQSLLEDRFQLKTHRETREMPIYNLTVAKDGSKLEAAVEGRPGPGGLPRGNFRTSGNSTGVTMTASAVNMPTFAKILSSQLRRPVIDKTNLTGFYDFTLKYIPQTAATSDLEGATVFTGLQEQLGLRLESARGPIDVLVIDSVQKPSDN